MLVGFRDRFYGKEIKEEIAFHDGKQSPIGDEKAAWFEARAIVPKFVFRGQIVNQTG
jgi:hypothetical protein